MDTKKIFALIVAFTLGVAIPMAHAAPCDPAAQYRVSDMNFDRIPLNQALAQAVEGTPLGIDVEGYTSFKMGAHHVTGPLDVVLNKMASFAHFTWTQAGCIVHVRLSQANTQPQAATSPAPLPSSQATSAAANAEEDAPTRPKKTAPRAPMPSAPVQRVRIRLWQVHAGSTLSQTIDAWATAADWTPYWELPKNKVYTLSNDATFTGDFHAAVLGLVAALNARGVWLRAHFSGGNRVLEISGTAMPQGSNQ
ncbi:MAG: TcpQ domain-containing protein [Betaproteobacteria bacterium]|nr:TcpQ domain-containing protein [Betaproteobacteria bacterium]